VEIIEREAMHISGPTTRSPLAELPSVVPTLWRKVFAGHDGQTVFAELSEEPGGDVHVITVGLLCEDVDGGGVPVPAGRWLHHEHRGPLTTIFETYGEMFTYASNAGLKLGTLKLDVGYRPDGREDKHDLHLLLADQEPGDA
jgi:hypothetical protein